MTTLGLSMGGYAALKFSKLLYADTAVAFSPQFSVDPSVVRDRRWQRFLHNVDMEARPTVMEEDLGDTRYFALFGGEANRDRRHAECFIRLPSMQVLMTANGYHNFPSQLKEAGVLDDLIDAAIMGDNLVDRAEFGLLPMAGQEHKRMRESRKDS